MTRIMPSLRATNDEIMPSLRAWPAMTLFFATNDEEMDKRTAEKSRRDEMCITDGVAQRNRRYQGGYCFALQMLIFMTAELQIRQDEGRRNGDASRRGDGVVSFRAFVLSRFRPFALSRFRSFALSRFRAFAFSRRHYRQTLKKQTSEQKPVHSFAC